jgi:hypothetical protein
MHRKGQFSVSNGLRQQDGAETVVIPLDCHVSYEIDSYFQKDRHANVILLD